MNNRKQDRKQHQKREKLAFKEAMHRELREHRSSFIVFYLLRVLVIVALVRQAMLRNYEGMFFCVLTILLFYIPSWLQVKLRIELPPALEITILCFIFAAEVLGEVNAFYVKVPNWDTMLHTLNGFLAAAVGFSLVVLLNDSEKLTFDLSPFFLALVAFCFSMTIGVLWEFFECAMDQLFLLDMQKDTVLSSISSVMLDPTGGNTPVAIKGITDVIVVANGEQIPLGVGGYLDVGILDTMKDLVVNFVGAVVFSFIGYFYVKGRGKGRFARRFIPRVLSGAEEEKQESEQTGE
ncbi:hypothetical protein [Dysosmobacter sp.]|uniref:hypothetical protein n=1 Tax=Dysosmobacter sp. TaxID=2591382 RepID=UPI002A87ABBD|nr:hypothetical protein [Dysosmobacter sp.]MDY3282495.1 hypothetical protein [Dysosmobacter sp.]